MKWLRQPTNLIREYHKRESLLIYGTINELKLEKECHFEHAKGATSLSQFVEWKKWLDLPIHNDHRIWSVVCLGLYLDCRWSSSRAWAAAAVSADWESSCQTRFTTRLVNGCDLTPTVSEFLRESEWSLSVAGLSWASVEVNFTVVVSLAAARPAKKLRLSLWKLAIENEWRLRSTGLPKLWWTKPSSLTVAWRRLVRWHRVDGSQK
jgi:hypothetical protein